MQRRYEVVCETCGEIESDTTSDGLYDKATANRRAGHHEGLHDGLHEDGHSCRVEVAEETNEYRCPVCQLKVTGEQDREDHARGHPGVSAESFVRV